MLNAYRYSDFCQGYNAKSRIAILANEKESVTSEQEIRNQIHIMIELLEDNLETQSVIRDLFDRIKDKNDIEVLSQFLNCLIEKDYQTLFDNIQLKSVSVLFVYDISGHADVGPCPGSLHARENESRENNA